IMRLCESKTITANEIHILNMDYPIFTKNWDRETKRIRSPCHCSVNSSTSKHAIITRIRSGDAGNKINVVIQGKNEQDKLAVGEHEYNIGYEAYNGSLPMHLVYNYTNKIGIHYMWFMINSDDDGDITLQCEESGDKLDDTLPEVCNVSSNLMTTTLSQQINTTITTKGGSTLGEKNPVSTTIVHNTTAVYDDLDDATTGNENLSHDDQPSKDTEQLNLGLIIGCVVAVVVVCLIVLVLVICLVSRHKKQGTKRNNSDDEKIELDSKQHSHTTNKTHLHNEY
ncbi:unnamed protein product, partial [Owenia fusiformis]